MALTEAGIVDKIIKDAVSNSSECARLDAHLDTPRRLPELRDLLGVFSLYATG